MTLRRRIDLVIEPCPAPAWWIRQGDFPSGWCHGEHGHPFFQTLYVLRGCGRHRIADVEVGLRAGDLLLIPPGCQHSWSVTGSSGLQLFDCSLLDEASDELVAAVAPLTLPAGRLRHVSTSALRPLLRAFAEEERGDDRGLAWRRSGLLRRYLGELLRILASVGCGDDSGDGLVAQARRCIEEEFHRALDLEGIAARVHVSGKHLCRLFASAGLPSPMQLLEATRCWAAAELLRNSDEAVAAIAARVGYGDARLFGRAFKRQYDMSPREYRCHHSGE